MFDAEAQDVFARAEERLSTTGFPPALGESLWSSQVLADFALISADRVSSHLPKHDPANYAHRSAVANLIDQLRRTDAITTLPGDWGSAKEMLLLELRDYLNTAREQRPAPTLSLLRWELQAAAATWDLDAALDIAKRWRPLDPNEREGHVIARTLFNLIVEYAEGGSSELVVWHELDDKRSDFLSLFADAITTARACRVEHMPPFFNPDMQRVRAFMADEERPTTPLVGGDPDDEDGLIRLVRGVPWTCLSFLDRLSPQRTRDAPAEGAISAWCEHAIGLMENDAQRHLRAAERYESLAQEKALLSNAYGEIRPLVHAAAAHCYGAAMKPAEAEREVREWIALQPTNARARHRLAEFLYKQDRIAEAIQAFEDHVRANDETDREDWTASLLLKLGLESLSTRDLTVALESAAFASPFRKQGEELVRWMAPATERLVKNAADRWWTALWLLTDEGAAANLGEPSIRQQAGAAFGEAVNMQIRQCIAGPFAAAEKEIKPPDQFWERFIRQTATLGDQVNCLLQAAHPNTSSLIARRLQTWLLAHSPALLSHLKTNRSTLPTLARLRGGATHDAISEEELRQLYGEALKLLEKIPGPRSA